MNYQQNQEKERQLIEFKEFVNASVFWHINASVITLTFLVMLTSTNFETESKIVMGILFVGIVYTISIAITAVGTAVKPRGFTPWFLPYISFLVIRLVHYGLDSAVNQILAFATLGVTLLFMEIAFKAWKTKMNIQGIEAGTFKKEEEKTDGVRPFEDSFLSDIESLKNKHGIQNIRVFIDE